MVKMGRLVPDDQEKSSMVPAPCIHRHDVGFCFDWPSAAYGLWLRFGRMLMLRVRVWWKVEGGGN